MRRLTSLLVVLLVVVGVGAVAVAVVGPSFGASPTVDYVTATVTRRSVVRAAAATGQVVPTATYALAFGSEPRLIAGTTSAAASGSSTWLVTEVDVTVGDRVRAGDVLAKADTSDLQAQKSIADANLLAARNQVASAKATLDAATTTDAKRQANIGYYNAVAQLQQVERNRSSIIAQIDAATLKAPADGIVTAVNIAAGVLAPNGDAIVIAAGPLEVSAEVAEADLGAVAVGQAASVTITALGTTATGKVTAIAPVAASSGTSSVVTYPVTIALDDPPTGLASGMSATVSVETGRADNVLAVPVTALEGSAGNYTIRVVDQTGQVAVRPVEVGLVGDQYVEIRSGVAEGEAVVTGTASTRQSTTSSGGFGIGIPGGGFGGGGRFGVPNR